MFDTAKYNKSMAGYDLQRYYDMLLVMREYHDADKRTATSNSNSNNTEFFLIILACCLYLGLLVWSIYNKELGALALVAALMVTGFIRGIYKHDSKSEFEEGFIKEAMAFGFSRGDATEFLYDVDWGDIQYNQSRVDNILKELEELKKC